MSKRMDDKALKALRKELASFFEEYPDFTLKDIADRIGKSSALLYGFMSEKFGVSTDVAERIEDCIREYTGGKAQVIERKIKYSLRKKRGKGKVKQQNDELRKRVIVFLEDNNLSMSYLSKKMGKNDPSQICQFIKGKVGFSEKAGELLESIMSEDIPLKVKAPKKPLKTKSVLKGPSGGMGTSHKEKVVETVKTKIWMKPSTPETIRESVKSIVDMSIFVEPLNRLTCVLVNIEKLLIKLNPPQWEERFSKYDREHIRDLSQEFNRKHPLPTSDAFVFETNPTAVDEQGAVLESPISDHFEPLPKNRKKELVRQNRARDRVGIRTIEIKVVTCLTCKKRFESTGNRMCDACKRVHIPTSLNGVDC